MPRKLFLFLLLASLGLPAAPKRKKRVRLPAAVERIIASSPALSRGHIGIRVVDLAGRVIYERNPRHWFVPASNTKLYSTALALSRLGPDFRFTTRLAADAAPDANGVLHADVRLIGSGDPSLSGRRYPYDKDNGWADSAPALEELAAQLARRGVREIRGSVIGDDTAFLHEPFPDGWSIDDPLYEYGAPVSALTLFDNAIRMEVSPGANPGEMAEVTLHPDPGHLLLIPSVATVPAGESARLRIDRPPFTTELRVAGSIAHGAPPSSALLAIDDPALYAAQAFTAVLQRQGIAVLGLPRALHRLSPTDQIPAAPVELAAVQSRPLSELIQVVNKVSQNLHAELFLRAAGGSAQQPFASRASGLEALKQFLETDVGLVPDDVNFEDGSGLSRLTLLTPEATTRLLLHMAASPNREVWFASLPVGGEDGTLARRFNGWAGKSRIRAKTGTLSHVSALGGYLDHPRRGRLAFTVVVNNYNAPASDARAGIDKLVEAFLE
jgi:serine-type D-Ala-D-Ala carboxypeptidase/endopeptidase (penicillin-binding protein 4)